MDIRTNAIRILTARCTLVQSAVRIAIACRLSVCLSVRDVDGSGSHRLKNLETNCTDNQSNTFALRRPKVIHQLPEEHGWEKWRSWSTKAAISLKRVQIEETLLWGTYRNSPTLYPTAPSPTPTASPSPRLGFAPHPKLQSLLSQERVGLKLRTSNLARKKSMKNFGEKGAWAYPGTAHFSGTPYLSNW